MKRILVLLTVIVVIVFAWRIADRLSADALGMAIGVAFGVIAGVPAALLVMASGRRRGAHEDEPTAARHPRQAQQMQGMPYGYLPQPPVIVLAGNGIHPQSMPAYPGMPQPRLTSDLLAAPPQSVVDSREFRVVGEADDSLDEW